MASGSMSLLNYHQHALNDIGNGGVMLDVKSELGLERFFRLISDAEKKEDLLQLFNCFFTPEELSALSLRVNVVKALLDGDLSQREIAKQLHTSISKVTRGSRQLKSISPELIKRIGHL